MMVEPTEADDRDDDNDEHHTGKREREHNEGAERLGRDSSERSGALTGGSSASEGVLDSQQIALKQIAIQQKKDTPNLDGGEIRVLILEDNGDDVELLKRELARHDLRCNTTIVDSEAAFATALREFKPDVILADFSLPSFDGLAALKLRETLAPSVPFIFVSSIIGEDVALESLKLGVTDYVLKDRLPRLGPAVRRAVQEARERKAFEHYQEIMRAILETSGDAILTIDKRGRIQMANPAAREIFEAGSSDLHGYRLCDIVPGTEEDNLEDLCLRTADEPDVELTGRKMNGQEFPVDIALTKLRINEDELFTAVIRDITERTKLRQQLKEQITQLETTNAKLAIARDKAQEASDLKSMFVANISHEIRTPMSGVLGMSELLLMSELEPDMRQMAAHIYECSKSLVAIVNDILDFSKLEAGKVRLERLRFSLQSVLDQVVQTISPAAMQKSLTVRMNVASDVPAQFYGDDGRIRQVLLNLAHNAIKFTPKGAIDIDVVLEQKNKETASIKFLVKDTGIGMSKASMESLFVPFTQADNSMTRKFGGTGLGLSICKSLVTLMSGEIGVESVEGEGSLFWVKLPMELASLSA